MKRTLIVSLCLLGMMAGVFFLPAGGYAYTIDLYSHEGLSGSAWAEITGDQTNTVTFQIGLGNETVADIRAFYFDLDTDIDTSELMITVDKLTDLNNDYTVNTVVTNWPFPSGSAGMQGAGTFEFGVEFGDPGIGNDSGDISEITFSIQSVVALTLGDDFGMRLMSFGEDRNESRKMLGVHEDVPVNPVPEPKTMLLLGLGLLGLTGMGRKLEIVKAKI